MPIAAKFALPRRLGEVLAGMLLAAASAGVSAEPPSLAERAQQADLVALAQVRDTDYLRRREIPVSGSAHLRLLIPYKTDGHPDFVEVYEKGLHEDECYFPDPSVFEEGRRYLLFLRRDPDDPERYRGLPGGCAVEVLVDRDNRYAVRLPITGLALPAADHAALETRAQEMQFHDRYAVVADEDLPPAQRDAMRDAGQIAPWPGDVEMVEPADALPPSPSPPREWIYTRGVPLSAFRELLQLEPDS